MSATNKKNYYSIIIVILVVFIGAIVVFSLYTSRLGNSSTPVKIIRIEQNQDNYKVTVDQMEQAVIVSPITKQIVTVEE